MNSNKESVYAGLSGVELTVDRFDLGNGIEIRKTFAHFFSANFMAFELPGPEGHHQGPLKAAKGGLGYDIAAEIEAPQNTRVDTFESKELLWLIVGWPLMTVYRN